MHTVRIDRLICAAGLFIDHQTIHIRANQQRASGFAGIQRAAYAGQRQIFIHLQIAIAQVIRDDARGSVFVEAQFGMSVQIPIDFIQFASDLFNFRFKLARALL